LQTYVNYDNKSIITLNPAGVVNVRKWRALEEGERGERQQRKGMRMRKGKRKTQRKRKTNTKEWKKNE
jgi:hypothetical protein